MAPKVTSEIERRHEAIDSNLLFICPSLKQTVMLIHVLNTRFSYGVALCHLLSSKKNDPAMKSRMGDYGASTVSR